MCGELEEEDRRQQEAYGQFVAHVHSLLASMKAAAYQCETRASERRMAVISTSHHAVGPGDRLGDRPERPLRDVRDR